MKLLDNVKRYLESEQRGLSIKKYAPPTSNNNSSMKDKSPEGEYANIIYDGIQLAEKYKNASEDERYLYYLENNILKKKYHQKFSLLHLAAQIGYPWLMEGLLKTGININQKDSYGETLLYIACSEGNARVVKVLLENRADCHIPVINGRLTLTCLGAACNCANDSIIQMLLDRGAKKVKSDYIFYRRKGGRNRNIMRQLDPKAKAKAEAIAIAGYSRGEINRIAPELQATGCIDGKFDSQIIDLIRKYGPQLKKKHDK
ncbi:MAG: ankyrin repeat domain-containing protein [Desulfobacteraceae bacterium]|nr:ankyrin repeat domain-containing protein [Desulfobacteraceae bacterium]